MARRNANISASRVVAAVDENTSLGLGSDMRPASFKGLTRPGVSCACPRAILANFFVYAACTRPGAFCGPTVVVLQPNPATT